MIWTYNLNSGFPVILFIRLFGSSVSLVLLYMETFNLKESYEFVCSNVIMTSFLMDQFMKDLSCLLHVAFRMT